VSRPAQIEIDKPGPTTCGASEPARGARMANCDGAVSIASDGKDVRGVLLDIAARIMGKKAVFAVKKDRWEKLAA